MTRTSSFLETIGSFLNSEMSRPWGDDFWTCPKVTGDTSINFSYSGALNKFFVPTLWNHILSQKSQVQGRHDFSNSSDLSRWYLNRLISFSPSKLHMGEFQLMGGNMGKTCTWPLKTFNYDLFSRCLVFWGGGRSHQPWKNSTGRLNNSKPVF